MLMGVTYSPSQCRVMKRMKVDTSAICVSAERFKSVVEKPGTRSSERTDQQKQAQGGSSGPAAGSGSNGASVPSGGGSSGGSAPAGGTTGGGNAGGNGAGCSGSCGNGNGGNGTGNQGGKP